MLEFTVGEYIEATKEGLLNAHYVVKTGPFRGEMWEHAKATSVQENRTALKLHLLRIVGEKYGIDPFRAGHRTENLIGEWQIVYEPLKRKPGQKRQRRAKTELEVEGSTDSFAGAAQGAAA